MGTRKKGRRGGWQALLAKSVQKELRSRPSGSGAGLEQGLTPIEGKNTPLSVRSAHHRDRDTADAAAALAESPGRLTAPQGEK